MTARQFIGSGERSRRARRLEQDVLRVAGEEDRCTAGGTRGPGEQRWPGGDRVDRLPKRQEIITSSILVPARKFTLTSVRVTAGITSTTKSAYSMCRPIG